MIKHLLKNIPNFTSEELKSDEAILISASDLINGTKDFLNKNFKGCFDNETITSVKKTIYVSLKKYSIFLNLVFKAVYGNSIVSLKAYSDDENIIYKIEFDTSILTEEDKKELSEILLNDKTQINFYDNAIEVKFKCISANFTTLNAVLTKTVYNYLQNYYFA